MKNLETIQSEVFPENNHPRFGARPQVMGILNATPDSFFAASRVLQVDAAIDQAAQMVAAGAELLDIGGESTRPGAAPVSAAQEIERVVPILEALHRRFSVTLSIDTSKPEVMTAALAAGATFLNDIRALRLPGALEVAAGSSARICLMHLRGEPATMQDAPYYADVVCEVAMFLNERVQVCIAAGISPERLVIDPGIGFGKSLIHNKLLLRHLSFLTRHGIPIMVGVSRKSLIGAILDLPIDQRLYGSIALALYAAWNGAEILRVHDVGPTVEALRVIYACQN